MPYDIGDVVRCDVEFRDPAAANALVSPTAVVFKVKDPDGTITQKVYGTDVDVVRDATGKFHATVAPTKAGTWRYRFEGTGLVQAAEEGQFTVRTGAF